MIYTFSEFTKIMLTYCGIGGEVIFLSLVLILMLLDGRFQSDIFMASIITGAIGGLVVGGIVSFVSVFWIYQDWSSYRIKDSQNYEKILYWDSNSWWFSRVIQNNTNEKLHVIEANYWDERLAGISNPPKPTRSVKVIDPYSICDLEDINIPDSYVLPGYNVSSTGRSQRYYLVNEQQYQELNNEGIY